MTITQFLIIFGAAVHADGSPSTTLRKRVEYATLQADSTPEAFFIVTGAIGRFGPAEAEVMRALLLDLGVDDERIICEPLGHDTLSSVIHCARIIAAYPTHRYLVTACSSSYHNPRCVWLLRLLNIPAKCAKVPTDRRFLPFSKWLRFCLKEPPALVWDTLLMVTHLLTGKVQRVRIGKRSDG